MTTEEKELAITEDYVSFEIAKLLKEKGFDEKCIATYNLTTGTFEIEEIYQDWTNRWKAYVSAPTLQMALKWLREEKHYYIQVMLDSWACGGHMGYYVVIQKTDSNFEMMLQDALDEVFYKTPEEACETAIKYVLENLI